jgi:hypothetical protein
MIVIGRVPAQPAQTEITENEQLCTVIVVLD